MRARNLFILFIIWAVGIQAQNSINTFTVLTFNVYGAPESEWPTRLGMILDELETLKPDVICLQEIVETPGTQGANNRAKILADSLFERTGVGYNYIWQRTHFSWSIFDEGIAIMSPHIILESDFVDLPRGLFTRKSLWVKVLTQSGIVNLFNTHLSFGNQEDVRIEQVKAIKTFVSEISTQNIASANVLCGDFNAIPGSPPIQLLTQEDTSGTIYLDSWDFINPSDPGLTIPSDNPDARIDYIMLKNDSETEILASKLVFKSPNTDNLFPSDHIGVISTFNTNIYALDIVLQNPGINDEVAGEIEISWSISNKTEDVMYKIFVSNNAGKSWQSLWEGESAANSYTWNTFTVPDGANYLLKVAAIGDTSYGLTQSTGTFVVNNPGNAAPELKLKSPRGGEFIENDLQIKWEVKDADSDKLSISIEHSVNSGASWISIVENIENTGSYLWDTNLVPNSSKYIVKVICADGSVTVSDSSKIFSIVNQRVEMPNSNFNHIAGNGSGTATGNVFDLDLLTEHEYSITFNDSLPGIKTYNVFDKQTAQFVLENATEMDGITEGPPFDGMRLVIFDYKEAKKDVINTRWVTGNTNLEHTISLPVILIGDETIHGFPYPADYKITMADQVVDTSSTYLNVEAIPMKFSVHNITENHRVDIIYFENNSDHTIGPLDKIYILEKDESGEPMITWLIFFANELSPIIPVPGDEFILATLKPFTNKDIFEFKATITGIEKTNEDTPYTFNLAQNYPNPFNSLTNITFTLQVSANVELSVYNIIGQRIKKLINKPLAAGSHSIKWDASNLASGLYFYKIEAGKYSAVKKALLIK